MTEEKRVLVIGGTGFLGYHTIMEFLRQGWQATAVGLPPEPPTGLFPQGVEIILKNVEQASDSELNDLFHGHAALVFAAGMDDRYSPRKPAYPKFHHANVEVPQRVLECARNAGIQKAVVFGSYFAHFNRIWPEMELAKRHAYIRSRVEQEQILTSISGLNVNILELPYIFGNLPVPGWKPLWLPLVKYIRGSRTVFYVNGGSACISVNTVARATFAAVQHGTPGACYPIGQENLTWSEMLTRLAIADGRQLRVLTIPNWILTIGLHAIWLLHEFQGREGGLNRRHFTPLQTAMTFIDPQVSRIPLGFEMDDLGAAFQATIQACAGKKE